jgi:hypothetical protein
MLRDARPDVAGRAVLTSLVDPSSVDTWRRSLAAEFEKKVAEIRESFDFFDRDNNGLIDFDEFRSLLKTVNPDATVSQAAEGFSMTDTNSDGYVDIDEFIAWWQSNWWEY